MLRVADGDGQAIAVEVWALPPDGFGRFVAGIPAPLGIGTIRLEGGTQAKGFLVEPQGVVGAKDISHFGGWRQYIAANDKTA
jgi:allophanate hydrolase